MRPITSCIICAPRAATALDCATTSRACCVLSALPRTVCASCCIVLAVCCSALAWLSVRDDRSALPPAISLDAAVTSSTVLRTSSTIVRSFLRIEFSSARSHDSSSLPGDSIFVSRSPPAMRITQCTVDSTDSLMLPRISHPTSGANSAPPSASTPMTAIAVSARASMALEPAASVGCAAPTAALHCSMSAACACRYHSARPPTAAVIAPMPANPRLTRLTRLTRRIHSIVVSPRGKRAGPGGAFHQRGSRGRRDIDRSTRYRSAVRSIVCNPVRPCQL